MKQELIRHKKYHLFVLIIIFFVMYVLVMTLVEVLNATINFGAGPLIAQVIFLYIYLMFILRHQLHGYMYTIEKNQSGEQYLKIEDILSKRKKTLQIIPMKHILSIEKDKKYKRNRYNKVLVTRKIHIKNTSVYYIEYGDMIDINLVKMTCSDDFAHILMEAVK